MTASKPTSFRLSERAHAMLADLKGWLGLQSTGVVEMAIRKLHQQEEKGRRPRAGKKSSEGA